MLIENGTVVTVDPQDRVLDPGWLRIEDGRIELVSDQPIAARPGEERLDASGLVVIPGLVNSHTHLFQTLIRGIYEGRTFSDWLGRIYHCGLVLTEEDFRIGARLGAVESLHCATTTIVEHHFLNGSADAAAATIEGLRSVGVRAVFARTAMDLGDLAPRQLLETPAQAVAATERVIAAWQGQAADGLLTLMVGPNTPGVSAGPDMVVAMADLAESLGLWQSMHVAESQAVVDAVRTSYGVDGVVRWMDGLGALRGRAIAAHSVHIDEGERAIMADRGLAIAHNPISNLFLGDGFAPIAEALEAGVSVGLGTDGAASNNSQDMLQVLKIAPLLQRARHQDGTLLGARAALRLGTLGGARALGLDHLVGSIEVGKRADLVLLDLLHAPSTVAVHDVVSQVVHCASSANVSAVLVDGQVRLAEGRVRSVDEPEVLAEAQAAGRSLARRLS